MPILLKVRVFLYLILIPPSKFQMLISLVNEWLQNKQTKWIDN